MMKVTDDGHVQDSKALPELVDEAIKSDKKIIIGKLLADGAYDGNEVFTNLADNGILPYIRVRKNARIKWKKETFLETFQF